jgi:hypothetical protein
VTYAAPLPTPVTTAYNPAFCCGTTDATEEFDDRQTGWVVERDLVRTVRVAQSVDCCPIDIVVGWLIVADATSSATTWDLAGSVIAVWSAQLLSSKPALNARIILSALHFRTTYPPERFGGSTGMATQCGCTL